MTEYIMTNEEWNDVSFYYPDRKSKLVTTAPSERQGIMEDIVQKRSPGRFEDLEIM